MCLVVVLSPPNRPSPGKEEEGGRRGGSIGVGILDNVKLLGDRKFYPTCKKSFFNCASLFSSIFSNISKFRLAYSSNTY